MSYILTAKNLKTTTNPVDVASAAEPTTGQVLTATSATTADWETPTTGVPYTGATADVDLGSWILTASQVYGTSSVKTPLLVDAGGTNIIDSPGRTLCDVSGGGIVDFYTANALKILKSGTAYGAILDPSSTTDNRTFTFPDVSGTIALTSDVPVKASGSEVDTGTDDAKFVTAKAINDSHNVPSVAPSTTGNVMTSNGTDWVSSAPAGASKWEVIGQAQLASPSATLIDVSSISTDYDMFRISYTIRANATFVPVLRLNNDATNTYTNQSLKGDNTTLTGARNVDFTGGIPLYVSTGSIVNTEMLNGTITISKPASGNQALVTVEGMYLDGSYAWTPQTVSIGGVWDNTSSKITRIAIVSNAGGASDFRQDASCALIEGIKIT